MGIKSKCASEQCLAAEISHAKQMDLTSKQHLFWERNFSARYPLSPPATRNKQFLQMTLLSSQGELHTDTASAYSFGAAQ